MVERRAFAHAAMGRRIDSAWWTIELYLVPTSVPRLYKKGHCMCYPVCGILHIKNIAANRQV